MHRASQRDLLDPSVLLALREYRVPGEADPAREVADTFLDVTPERLERLRAAAQRGDGAEVSQLAHQMRGSCATVGAVAMHAVASELEATGADAPRLVRQLEGLFTRTRPLLVALARAPDAP